MIARSPIAPPHPLAVEHGWEVSARRSSAPLRLQDLTPLAKVDLRAPDAGATATSIGIAFGASGRSDGALVIGSGPGEWLALGPPGTETALTELLDAHRDPDEHTSVVELTHGRALVRLTGQASREALSKLCGVDLSPGAVADGAALRSSVARLATDVVRDDQDGLPSFLLHCERSSGQYLFDCILDAGREHGIDIDGFASPGIRI